MREQLDLSQIEFDKILVQDFYVGDGTHFNVKSFPQGQKFVVPQKKGLVMVISSTAYKHEIIAEAYVRTDPTLNRMYESLRKKVGVKYLPYKDFLIFEFQALAVYDKEDGYVRNKVEASDINSETVNNILATYVRYDYQVDFQDPLYRQMY